MTSKYEYKKEDWPWVWAIREALDCSKGLSSSNAPVPLTPYLFLGSMIDACQKDKLKRYGITHILNVAGSRAGSCAFCMTIDEYQSLGISLRILEGKDKEGYPMLEENFEEAYKFIKTIKNMHGSTDNPKNLVDSQTVEATKPVCLIHCEMGLNRSVLLACAAIMMLEKKNVIETVLHLRRQRGKYALFNKSFQEQLVAFARVNDLLGPRPGDEGSIVGSCPPPENNPSSWIIVLHPKTSIARES